MTLVLTLMRCVGRVQGTILLDAHKLQHVGALMMQWSERQPASSCYSVVCRRCTKGSPIKQDAAVQRNGLDIENGDVLESMCLGDMLNADGGADSLGVEKVRWAWKKVRELSPSLTFKGAFFKLKGSVRKLYDV